ncbi:VOC family protein [Plantactinospora sp. GCM10030261]|uniref:VOC family protein n=1 Tax=Plantactinospora sp. GCM10030261 TaxID=3273420 RepID=UPI00361A4F29
MRTLYPIFKYADAKSAIDWLETAFGFVRHQVYDGPDGSVAHAELAFGDGMIMVGQTSGPLSRPADDAWSVYVAVDDIDAHHERARAAGAEITIGLRDTDYGSREYAARDVEGYVWSFGTYRP